MKSCLDIKCVRIILVTARGEGGDILFYIVNYGVFKFFGASVRILVV